MKKETSHLTINIIKRIFGYLSNSGNKKESINIIVIAIELLISALIYILYNFNIIRFATNDYNNFIEGILDFITILGIDKNATGSIIALILINFPSILLLNGVYSIKNYTKEYSSKKMNISGILMIFFSLIIIAMSLLTKNKILVFCNIATYISTLILIFYFLVIAKIDYFSVRQLIFIYFSIVLFLSIVIVIVVIIAIIIAIIAFYIALACLAGASESNVGGAGRATSRTHKIRRNENDPKRGVMLDSNDLPLTDDHGEVVEVTDIDEINMKAKVNGETIELKEDK